MQSQNAGSEHRIINNLGQKNDWVQREDLKVPTTHLNSGALERQRQVTLTTTLQGWAFRGPRWSWLGGAPEAGVPAVGPATVAFSKARQMEASQDANRESVALTLAAGPGTGPEGPRGTRRHPGHRLPPPGAAAGAAFRCWARPTCGRTAVRTASRVFGPSGSVSGGRGSGGGGRGTPWEA